MLFATASTQAAAPIVVAQRLRKCSCGSSRGAKRLVADALKTVRSLHPESPVLLRRTPPSTAAPRSARPSGPVRTCRSRSG